MGGLDRPTAGRVLYRGRDLYAAGDRERSAIRAREIGSDLIVVGRPITAAEDPVAAYRRCVAEFVG